jgi:ubiquinone/menaquinone biosynthesis C-methylase UbiE
VLVAGGGTGSALLYLAEQLRHTDAQLVYLDFSWKSLDIARQRAQLRGLRNIRWVHNSIENIESIRSELGEMEPALGHSIVHPDLQ